MGYFKVGNDFASLWIVGCLPFSFGTLKLGLAFARATVARSAKSDKAVEAFIFDCTLTIGLVRLLSKAN